MKPKLNLKSKGVFHYVWRTGSILIVCTLVYYLPAIVGFLGWTSSQTVLNRLHDFYGLDIYALGFFIPVVYAAYVVGVFGVVITALVSMLPLLYHELVVVDYPSILFRPTAFVIILSAVGAAIAMIQKNDIQRERSLNELKCLYDVGKASEVSTGINEFISEVVKIIAQNLCGLGETQVRANVRDISCTTPGFIASEKVLKEELIGGGEILGSLEMYCNRSNSYLDKQRHWIKILAERIGSAIHEIELEQSLRGYYEQLEDMVEKRTRDLEQAQEKLIRTERLAAVGELASGVGHELRNPLNVIRNGVYLLNMSLENNIDQETKGVITLLDHQVDVMNRIVTDLLDFTRVRPPALASVNLNSLIKESLSLVTVPQNVSVKTALDTGSPQILVDAEQIGRAFTNVIFNAVQAMGSGGELRVNTGTEDGYAFASFEDTGCGIPAENLDRLFEPLFTTKPKGIGLGLSITKRLVGQNGGNVEVKSEVGKGTTFTLKLPRQKGDKG